MTEGYPGLLHSEAGHEVVYSVLAAVFHLNPLGAADEARLEAAADQLRDWVGGALRWTTGSVVGPTREFEGDDLDFISTYAGNLDVEIEDPGTELEELEAAALSLTGYALHCYGAPEETRGSPFTLSFFADIPEVVEGRPLEPASVLRITVPEDWPIEDFERRVLALAQVLPVRWGAAGYSFAGDEHTFHEEFWRKVYAHSRRHPGYDVCVDALMTAEFHDRIRSVSWLTFVGEELARDLPLAVDPIVEVTRFPGFTCLRAGDRPLKGDHNRGDYPRAYVQADALVRPVRAAAGFDFGPPWDARTTEEWLRRFERPRH